MKESCSTEYAEHRYQLRGIVVPTTPNRRASRMGLGVKTPEVLKLGNSLTNDQYIDETFDSVVKRQARLRVRPNMHHGLAKGYRR